MSSGKGIPNVAKAGGIMMVSLLLSRVLGIGRDMIIAWMFGQDKLTDAYRLSFMVPDLLFFLIAGGALSSAFIPVFSEYLHTDREDEAWHIFSSVTTIMSILVFVFILVAWLCAMPLTAAIAPGKDPSLYPAIAMMSRIILPAQFAFFVGGLMIGTLYSRQVFIVPGLAMNVYNIAIIVGAVAISRYVSPNVAGMSWGALAGAFAGNMIIPYLAMRKMGSKFRFVIDFKHPGVKQVFKLMVPVILGLSLPGVYAMIIQWIGTYYSEGVNTALDVSNKVMQAPLGVFGQALAIAAFPALSQFFAQKKMDVYRDQLAKSLRQVAFLSVPISVLLIAIPHPIVKAVFEHGKFDAAATERTAACLQTFSIGIAAWCMHPILMRGYFAMQKTLTPIIMGTGATAVFMLLIGILRLFRADYSMYPLAGSIVAILLIAVMLIGIRKTAGGLDLVSILTTVVKTTVASVVAVAPLYATLRFWSLSSMTERLASHRLPWIGHLAPILIVGFLCLCFAWLYYFLCRWMKMPETEYVNRALKRKAKPEAE